MESDKRKSLILILFLLTSTIMIESQAPAIPDINNNSYNGLYWGAAGISSGLIQIIQNLGLQNPLKSEIENMAEASLNSVWNNRYKLANETKIPSWSKYRTGDIYPGVKYGAAGISKVFIEFYQYTGDRKYLDWAIQSIEELFRQTQFVSSSWPYSYSDIRNTSGIPITDISFGSLGILDTTLILFEQTNVTKYLSMAIKLLEWLDKIAISKTIGSFTSKLLPWYVLTPEFGPLYSSYYSGNAAAIPLFIKLGELTKNESITNWAYSIADTYRKTQNPDGSWPIILDKPDSITRTNLELGSAGILQALLQLPNDYYNNNYTIITKGIDWLFSQIKREGNSFFIPLEPNLTFGKFGKLTGLTGIFEVIRKANLSSYDTILSEWYDHLLNNIIYTKKIKGQIVAGSYPSSKMEVYTDLSYSDGLIGIAIELSEIVDSNYSNNTDLLQETLTSIVQTYLSFQESDSLWPKQITLLNTNKENDKDINLSIWMIGGGLIIAISLLMGYRKRKFQP